jgi:transcriptional regulator with XRE-family HTH domain
VGKPQRELDPFRTDLKELRIALGHRIRELRQVRGWSQENFAAEAHVHRTFAGALERGEKNLSFHALVLIARCFGITASDLLSGLEEGGTQPLPRKKARSEEFDRTRILTELVGAEKKIKAAQEILSPSSRPRSGSLKK